MNLFAALLTLLLLVALLILIARSGSRWFDRFQ